MAARSDRNGRPNERSPARSLRGLALGLALYGAWTFATWLLEGRVRTLLRPEAVFERAIYAVVANILIGTVGAVLCVAWLSRRGVVRARAGGFPSVGRTWVSVVVGLLLGGLLAWPQLPDVGPAVLVNSYAQVLVVSVAEVLVCWAVLGGVTRSLASSRSPITGWLAGAVVASLAFGLYHVAHSPPFDQPVAIAFLSALGLVTSLFFFASRDVYGTIAFHNWLGTIGVVSALEASERLAAFASPSPSRIGTALVALVVLVALDALVLRTLRPLGAKEPAASPQP